MSRSRHTVSLCMAA